MIRNFKPPHYRRKREEVVKAPVAKPVEKPAPTPTVVAEPQKLAHIDWMGLVGCPHCNRTHITEKRTGEKQCPKCGKTFPAITGADFYEQEEIRKRTPTSEQREYLPDAIVTIVDILCLLAGCGKPVVNPKIGLAECFGRECQGRMFIIPDTPQARRITGEVKRA
jgi:transposase-like protein